MALLDSTDLQRQKNITLTSDGVTLANAIANGILKWAERHCHRTFAKGSATEYFSPESNYNYFQVRQIPLDTGVAVTIKEYNPSTNTYDDYTGTVRAFDTGEIQTSSCLASGFKAVQIAYTGGYTALPDDLKQALTELLAQKWDAASEGGKTVTEVSSGAYTEKYAITDRDIPADILEVVDSYVLPVIL